MLRLHASVYARPPSAVDGPEVTLRGLALPTLVDAGGGPPRFLATLPATFEPTQARLAELSRSDVEPDGFFLLTGGSATGDAGETFWRLNGHLHEFEERLHRVELNGECPAEPLDAVLRTLGWPGVELAFELVQEGVTLAEKAFRVWAAASRGGPA